MIIPKTIDITIVWDDWAIGSNIYSMGRDEIIEVIYNYDLENDQPDLFSYFPVKVIKQWIWDVFAREPYEVVVETINY